LTELPSTPSLRKHLGIWIGALVLSGTVGFCYFLSSGNSVKNPQPPIAAVAPSPFYLDSLAASPVGSPVTQSPTTQSPVTKNRQSPADESLAAARPSVAMTENPEVQTEPTEKPAPKKSHRKHIQTSEVAASDVVEREPASEVTLPTEAPPTSELPYLNPAPTVSESPAVLETPTPSPLPTPIVTPTPSPTPTPTPSPSPASTPSQPPFHELTHEIDDPNDFATTRISIAPDYLISDLSSRDRSSGATSNLTSQVNLGANLAYRQEWTPDFSTFLGLRLGYISLNQIADNTKTLTGGSAFLDSVAIGMRFGDPAHSSFFLEADVSDTKELFERAVSTNSVTIDAISTPELHLEPGFRLFAKRPLILGVSFPLGIEAPASTNSYTTQLGESYGIKFFLIEDLGHEIQMTTSAGYFMRNQNTSITTQTQSDLGFSLGFSFPLSRGPEQNK
jgi:hypothetical protein